MRTIKLLFKTPKTYLWIFCTAIMVFYQAEINNEEWAAWVPNWLSYIALPLVMATTFLPFVQEARREKLLIEETLRDHSTRLDAKIQTLAKAIKDRRSWTAGEAEQIRQSIIDPLPDILNKAGIHEPRVCFYKAVHEESKPGSPDTKPKIIRLDFACKAGGTQPPSARIDREEATPEDHSKKKEARETLFKALDERQPSHLLKRPDHTSDSTWRSALRCPVFLDDEVYGIITVDSPKKGSAHKRYAAIVNISASMLAITQHIIDNRPSPSMTEMQIELAGPR